MYQVQNYKNTSWIPTFAGMTFSFFVILSLTENPFFSFSVFFCHPRNPLSGIKSNLSSPTWLGIQALLILDSRFRGNDNTSVIIEIFYWGSRLLSSGFPQSLGMTRKIARNDRNRSREWPSLSSSKSIIRNPYSHSC